MVTAAVKKWNPFSATTWIAWLSATVVAAATMTAFAFMTFETKESSKEHRETGTKLNDERYSQIIQRMDRIESKLDLLIQKRN